MAAMSDPSGPFGFDPRLFQQVPLFRELAKVMSWQGGPVNWDLAGQTATALAPDDDAASAGVGEGFGEAVATAEHWLDEVTSLAAVSGPAEPLTPAQWTERAATAEGLGGYIEPIAEGAAEALGEHLPEELQQLGGTAGSGAMQQAMSSMGAMLYGLQAGVITGHLAQQLWSCYELGVPTLDPRRIGPVGTGADQFAADYDLDAAELRHWLALSEAVHRRMFAGVPWLGDQLRALVREFAAEAEFDPQQLMDSLGGSGLDPSDPQALQEALQSSDAFRMEPTQAQQRVLDRLQALVSFTEAYADTVVHSAAGVRLPALGGIEEARWRRRVEHGPGERFLAQLVGLDLTPGDLRTAQAFCQAVIDARGQEGLERVWEDPVCLPELDELHEPSRWLVRMAARELGVGDDEG
jgi:putative hydrolase